MLKSSSNGTQASTLKFALRPTAETLQVYSGRWQIRATWLVNMIAK